MTNPSSLINTPSWLAEIQFNEQGLIPVIAQDHETNDVLMVAWMNAQALQETIRLGQAVYYSRSRQKLWHKGEESGHFQDVYEIRLDCDSDVLLLKVKQLGNIACHTGRHSCFYRKFNNGGWEIQEPVLKDPATIYKHPDK